MRNEGIPTQYARYRPYGGMHDVVQYTDVSEYRFRGAIKSRVSGFFYFPEHGVGSNRSDIRVTVIVYFVNRLLICRAEDISIVHLTIIVCKFAKKQSIQTKRYTKLRLNALFFIL